MTSRDEVIAKAKKFIAKLPKHQYDALKYEFDRAELEARKISDLRGSRD